MVEELMETLDLPPLIKQVVVEVAQEQLDHNPQPVLQVALSSLDLVAAREEQALLALTYQIHLLVLLLDYLEQLDLLVQQDFFLVVAVVVHLPQEAPVVLVAVEMVIQTLLEE
tara:strand:- start:59 stop:397 length:339 start_codon:yes stop_codon:yes gene_type:complete